MKNLHLKLIAISVALFLSVAAVVTVSYAWLVLSVSPEIQGMQISIGGGTSILVAADLQKTLGGAVYHYPDAFSSALNFTEHKSYAYLDTLSGLLPVSTSDGLSWYIPDYYDLTDPEVHDGEVFSGSLKPIEHFYRDDFLQHANLKRSKLKPVQDGHYIYLDFWVVSPSVDCVLRVSAGDDSGNGSYLIGLPTVEETADGYRLVFDDNDASACIRVGFLANPDEIIDTRAISVYENSPGYTERYAKIKGIYAEPNGAFVYSSDYRFTIYEPNGDYHPAFQDRDGEYLITSPITNLDGTAAYGDVTDRLTVQLQNSWTNDVAGTKTLLEQQFETASYVDKSREEIFTGFYQKFLNGQVAPFVTKGQFVKNTAALYENAEQGIQNTDGATDDVYIVELEADVPQCLRMFVWIEGTDADCINTVKSSALAFSIELAGSEQK